MKPIARHRQHRRPADDRGSMAILMMVMLVGLMLGALVVPMVVTQARTTRFDITRVQALDAAQAGIDVTLGQIRAGVTTEGIGDAGKLPCGTLAGFVTGTNGPAYQVVVEYFTFDPGLAKNPRSTPPESEPYPSSNTMSCPPSPTPAYARLTSTGTVGTAANGSTAGRTLTATYALRTSNVNLLGGQIALSTNGSASSLCIDTGPSTSPSTMLQTCTVATPSAVSQAFAYRSDLTLQLLSSIPGSLNKLGLCLDTEHQPALSSDLVVLSPCGPLGQPVATQQWSYNDNSKFEAARADSSTSGNLTGLCMTVNAQLREKQVRLGDCGSAATWAPSPPIGSGAATSSQRGGNAAPWINYSEFSRCLNVPSQNPDSAYLIDYPCTQNPYPGTPRWNQLFQSPYLSSGLISVTGQISTTAPGRGQVCLTSPGTNGGYPVVRTCTGAAAQSWTIYGGDKSLNYSTKFTVVSGSLCLGLSTNRDAGLWSIIDVETCNGSPQQKWNAVSNVLTPTMTNTREK